MITSTFDSTKRDLIEILRGAAEGEIQLPDFQRGWVWDDEHIIDLLASVSRSFPIGTLMLLETGGDAAFKVRTVEGVSASADTAAKQLILDGQQRITSLFQSLLSGKPVMTRDSRKVALERWYYVDIQRALDPSTDRTEAIFSVPADRRVMTNFGRDVVSDYSAPELEQAAGVFPLAKVFDHREWARQYTAFHGHAEEIAKRFDEFEADVIERFTHYQLPIITLSNKTPKEAVCLVFEKVNTGGVPLSVFELLTATFAAQATDEFQLREDWDARRKRLVSSARVLGDVAANDFIQVVSLLTSFGRREGYLAGGGDPDRSPAVSCRRRDLLNLTLADYLRWAPEVEDAFRQAARFLHRQFIFEAKFLPYSTQLVPLVALFVVLGKRAEDQPVWERLVRWYWCGVFGELYGSTVETRFARDLVEVVAWLDGGPEPRTVTEANFSPQRLSTLRTRRSAAYRGIYSMLLREGARDFRTGEPSNNQSYFDEAIDIHHIFPQKWCRDHGVGPEVFDTVVNKTPLSARTNRIIGGSAPSSYLAQLTQSHGVTATDLDTSVGTHLIDASLLRSDNFEAFMDARQVSLLAQIGQAMGKALVPEPDIVATDEGDELDLAESA